MITDKLVAKIPSSYAGKVSKLNFKNDDICQVGQSLLEMEVSDDVKVKEEPAKEEPAPEQKPEPTPAPAPAAPAAESKPSEPAPEGKVLATPAVRGLAAELKVDLKKVKATGKGGRVTKSDVLKFAEAMKSGAAPAGAPIEVPKTAPVALAEDRVVKLTGIRRGMTKSMTEALHIPHYNIQEEFEVDKLAKIRSAFSAANPKNKISFLPFFVKACSQVMIQMPVFNAITNSTVDQDGYIVDYVEKADHNISIAVDTPSGLVVPCLKAVQKKSIMQINDEMKQLIDRARKGTLTKADLSDSTFTISSIGSLGCMTGSPVIFRPQVAIMAMGKTSLMPVFTKQKNGEYTMKPKETMCISLSCDHRIIDGATGARFVGLLKKYIEDIDTMLLGMI